MLHQFSVSAQDLLVTADGDSLNCKITKMKSDYVYFTFSHQDEVRNTLLPKSQVKYYQHNFYGTSDVQPHQITFSKPEFSHWRFAVNAGWSYRLAPLPDGLSSQQKEYLKKLKSGLGLSFDATYFITEVYGVGFKYDLFKTSNTSSYGEDNITIPFIGPAFAMRLYDQSKSNCWFMNIALGYMGFKDEGKQSGQPVTLKGSTFGLATDIGYDIALSKNWSAGIQLSVLSGVLTSFDQTSSSGTQTIKLEKDEYEGLGRLSISIGLRCNL